MKPANIREIISMIKGLDFAVEDEELYVSAKADIYGLAYEQPLFKCHIDNAETVAMCALSISTIFISKKIKSTFGKASVLTIHTILKIIISNIIRKMKNDNDFRII